jgi:peroxiredoxin family protein
MTTTTTAPAIVPNFDDEDSGDRKLVIICSKGNLDMAYPGLVLANAALGEGIETHMFFTFWGLDIILKSRMNDLKFTPVGNTAMHLPVGDARVPQILSAIPGMQGMSTKMMKKQISDLGVPEVPDFLEQITAAGGHLWACRMSVDMLKVTEDDMYEGVEAVINATNFMELSAGGQLLFI